MSSSSLEASIASARDVFALFEAELGAIASKLETELHRRFPDCSDGLISIKSRMDQATQRLKLLKQECDLVRSEKEALFSRIRALAVANQFAAQRIAMHASGAKLPREQSQVRHAVGDVVNVCEEWMTGIARGPHDVDAGEERREDQDCHCNWIPDTLADWPSDDECANADDNDNDNVNDNDNNNDNDNDNDNDNENDNVGDECKVRMNRDARQDRFLRTRGSQMRALEKQCRETAMRTECESDRRDDGDSEDTENRSSNDNRQIHCAGKKGPIAVSHDEFVKLARSVRGRAKVEAVNAVLEILVKHFRKTCRRNVYAATPISVQQLTQLGAQVSGQTGRSSLNCLRHLKYVDIQGGKMIVLTETLLRRVIRRHRRH